MAFGRRALRGTTPQLRSHALRPAERSRRTSVPVEEHSGGSGGQASRGPGGGGDGPRRPARATRALGLGAHEGRRLHRASLTSSTSLHLQHHQATSSRVLVSAGSAHRAAPFPGRVGPSPRHVSILFMLFIYLVGGAPRAASSPCCSGPTQRRLLLPALA